MRSFYLVTLLFVSVYCKADSWIQRTDFPNGQRAGAFAFTIGDKGYVGGGLDMATDTTMSDFWEYDPATDTWTQKADFPGYNSAYAASFAIGNKGYVCTGISQYMDIGTGNTYTQVYRNTWAYDPATNTWTQKPYFPGIVRGGAASFVIDSIAYVGSGYGYGAIFRDFYAYNPATNLWHSVAPLPDSGSDGSGFSVLNRGYVTGIDRYDMVNNIDVYTNALWQYNPVADTWTTKAVFPGDARVDAFSFTLDNNVYYGTGYNNSGALSDLWEYDPVADTWAQKMSMSSGRDGSAYFSVGNKGYTVFGGSHTPSWELWEYSLNGLQVPQPGGSPLKATVRPNPFTDAARITFDRELENGEIILSDIYGREVFSGRNIHGNEILIQRKDLASGVYFYTVKENGVVVVKDKVIVQ